MRAPGPVQSLAVGAIEFGLISPSDAGPGNAGSII